MKNKLTKERVKELQALNLPRLRAGDLFKHKEENPPEESIKIFDKIDKYLNVFVNTENLNKCINCGAGQGASDLADVILGKNRFTWGLAHGEGYCLDCGYPGRAYHYIEENEPPLNMILQYHPNELVSDKEETNE